MLQRQVIILEALQLLIIAGVEEAIALVKTQLYRMRIQIMAQ